MAATATDSNILPQQLAGANEHDKLASLCLLSFKNQTVWFLNVFWDQVGSDAEKLWGYVIKCNEYDLQHAGAGLDELNAHRFLEFYNETMTVRELRTALRSSGALSEADRPKLVPLAHVLIFKYKVNWRDLVNAVAGDNAEELARAQALLDEANAKLAACQAAYAELEAAQAELRRQEDEYNGKIADAKARSESGGVVQRNKAANELAQLQAEDPLPLRRAKLTVAAALRKAEQSLQAAQQAFDQASAYLAEVKSRGGAGSNGSLWWMERELTEQRKYLPSSRGGTAK